MERQKTELKMIRMSEVESQEVKWLWYPFILYGKLTIIQGDPGDGKTTLVLNIAEKLSKGECLDSDMDVQEPVNVIYQTAEDGLADTVKPRLEIAGADCEKILFIDESDKSLSMADERLEEALAKTEEKVLILDPIQAYLGGGMDMNRANEARDMTKKLGALAEKYQCAILLIGHMNKASGNKAAYRGMGSIDFFAVARSVLLVGRIEGEPNTRAVVQIKNNLAAFGHPKAFMLSEMGFHWLGDYEITADEVLGGIAPKANKLEQAKQMLRELAEKTNMVQSNEIFEMADKQGISKRTLENAKKELGIRAKKIQCVRLKEEVLQLRKEKKRLSDDVEFYKGKIKDMSDMTELLQEKADDLERVKRYAGAEQIDTIIRKVKEQKRKEQQIRRYDRSYGTR